MATRRINSRLIKLHRSYSVDEVARRLEVHKNSVRGWIRKGLPTLDKCRPVLILGRDLREFLDKQSKARKQPCSPGTLYCFKCRLPSRPALGMVEYVPLNALTGNIQALCETCGTMMNRRARLDALAVKMPNLEVQIGQAPSRIIGRVSPSLNCDN